MKCIPIILLALVISPLLAFTQQPGDSLLQQATLDNCIQYALQHHPDLKAATLDEQITETTIKSKLADWYPQLNLDVAFQHYLQLPTTLFPDLTNPGAPKRKLTTGVENTITPAFTLTQTIFNRDVLLANRTKRDVRLQVQQATANTRINITASVAKAFYDVLLTQQQIKTLDITIDRLEKSLKDAYYQYQSGITDKTDYKRATIALNNAKADRKTAIDQLASKYQALKQQMGYPTQGPLHAEFDSTRMQNDLLFDTTQTVKYEDRIEYQQLITTKRLLESNVKYNQWNYLPSLNLFGSYNPIFQSDQFGNLVSTIYPYSVVGLHLSWSIFQGGKRVWETRGARLQVRKSDWQITSLKNEIDFEYSQALSAYKSNLNEYNVLHENVELAQDVYNTIDLQYRNGIKTYLDVIIAETDLRTAQQNYYNSMFQVLSSKIDVEKALGTLTK